ncbi:hypothetical protein, variant [Puccinia triticina 1-1 BBBD Race 1]|uniref:Secreted protein n=2 Tax=Puccinia triticina TaxID=208348 RepID=A0A180H6D6_PUCT1|nr:uncharacterized protein PtA15_9A165 [Puccinia triticina]OAW00100.1 hypothetical protein PTTG_12337 [Puccinia triticina 1-1 BBBD Race 1]OAW00101.1 hypothetical protein, variant [Puccinia triticina 1-1 BBBD Race 1]WAQ88040.1 hypothetical protein PtA15_9A165 [Puccinia triticina]WAR60236.1 hypothetical protein PtB15_9B173 [Puccinia triticina]
MHRAAINLVLFGLSLFSSLESSLAHHSPNKLLKTRAPDNNEPKNGTSKPCQTYYSANTPHAVCNGDRSMMCLAGCTGGVVAQNCQLNSSSPLTTETCSVAFSQTSETAYLCNTPQGAYTCQGPQTGGVVCHNCVSTPNGVLPSNTTSTSAIPGHSNSTNEHDSQDTSSDSSKVTFSTTMALPGLLSIFISAAIATLL